MNLPREQSPGSGGPWPLPPLVMPRDVTLTFGEYMMTHYPKEAVDTDVDSGVDVTGEGPSRRTPKNRRGLVNSGSAASLQVPLRMDAWTPREVAEDEPSTSTPTPSHIPKSRFRKASDAGSSAHGSPRGTTKSPRLNKALPPNPDPNLLMPPRVRTPRPRPKAPKVSGIPIKARATLKVAEDSPGLDLHYDNESVLNLADGHRRSLKLGISGPSIRFSKDCDEAIMGIGEVTQRKEKVKKSKSLPPRTPGETPASRFAKTPNSRSTILSGSKGSEFKTEGLKSRVSAMLNRRPRATTAPALASSHVSTPRRSITPGAHQTSVMTPPATAEAASPAPAQADARVRTSDELFEAGLHQLNVAIAQLGHAAAKVADGNETSQFTVRVRAIVDSVNDINDARLARIKVLNSLECLAVAEVVGVREAVDELNEITEQLS